MISRKTLKFFQKLKNQLYIISNNTKNSDTLTRNTILRNFIQKEFTKNQNQFQLLHSYNTFRFTTTNQQENPQKVEKTEEEIKIEKSNSSQHEFKAETKKLLDIVAKSLYTDKDVFIRELISNASDSLEKQRFLSQQDSNQVDESQLEITITTNEAKRQIILQDTGIGMTKEELIDNLGTIARSGSKNFLDQLSKEQNNTMGDKIIGQFGVGFYSAFIVADLVEVISKSDKSPDAYIWTSEGAGKFELSKISNAGFQRGTKIIIHLKPENASFAKKIEVQKVIKRYSNFLTFPINLNGEKINIVSAIWARDKRDIKDDDYLRFWEEIANTKLSYRYRQHFQADAPLSIKALFYIPQSHNEKYGVGMEEMDMHLYSKKVLIKKNCRELLPNYMRFVKGVVDCEDIPLNISRENYQNSALVSRLKSLMTKRVLKLLEDEANKDEATYLTWFQEFQFFLKEGLASDQDNQAQLMKLTRYQSSFSGNNFVSIPEYLKQMKPGQDKIYFILAPNKDSADNSPFIESFKQSNIPVLYTYVHVDEMVFRGVQEYEKFKFVNIETNFEDISKDIKETEHNKVSGIPEDDITPLCLWVKNELSPVVQKVQISKRLNNYPAIILGQMSTGMRQIMQMIEKNENQDQNKNLNLEINPNHPLIVKLNQVRKINKNIASLLAKQILDNAMLNSGMVQDQKKFLERIQELMSLVMDSSIQNPALHLATKEPASRPEIQQENKQSQKQSQAEVVIDKDGNPTVIENNDKKI